MSNITWLVIGMTIGSAVTGILWSAGVISIRGPEFFFTLTFVQLLVVVVCFLDDLRLAYRGRQ